jgi:phosphatidylserine synthase
MDEQKDFFTKDHGRLLDIAVAAKNIAWVVLVIYIVLASLRLVQYNWSQFGMLLSNDPLSFFGFVINELATVIQGTVYYLVLKGISLGLNMIVETDINYREREGDN